MPGNGPFDEPDAGGEPYNDRELISVLSRFVKVDRVSGAPVLQDRFGAVEPPAQAVALMLYRHVADSLGQLAGDVPVEADWLADHSDLYVTEVPALAEELPFVVERAGHLEIPRDELGEAVAFLADRS